MKNILLSNTNNQLHYIGYKTIKKHFENLKSMKDSTRNKIC